MAIKPNELPYVFSSSEADQAVAIFAESQIKNVGLGVQWSDDFPSLANAPSIMPAQTWVVQACTGEGKSLLASWWARELSRQIKKRGEENTKKILVVKLEESIELARVATMQHPVSFADIASGKIDMDQLKLKFALSSDDPLCYIGPSLSGEDIHPDASIFNGITPAELAETVSLIKSEMHVEIAGVLLDYVQLMSDNDKTSNRTERTTNASMEMVQLVRQSLKCPTLVCAQSKLASVKARANKIPLKEDIQHSSQIAQDCDVLWALWKPASDMAPRSEIKIQGRKIPVFLDMLVCQIDKWRHTGMDGKTFIIGMTKPGGQFGDLYEVDLDMLSRVDINAINQEGILYLTQLEDRHFK